jgi:ribosomal protein L37AE/L43A
VSTPADVPRIEVVVRNSARCRVCGTEVVSRSRHDFQSCGCPEGVFVDGGTSYIRGGARSLASFESTARVRPETAEEYLRRVVRVLDLRGIFPGPTAINAARGRTGRLNRLNGRDNFWRTSELRALGYESHPDTGRWRRIPEVEREALRRSGCRIDSGRWYRY